MNNPRTPSTLHSASSLPAAERPAESIHDGSKAMPSGPRRILLVDDDNTVRDSLGEVLASEGYAVLPAEDGEKALELAAREDIDLVMLDLNMPVKNGWDTLKHLTTEWPLLPVVIITARPNQVFTAVGAGVAALIEKPLDCRQMLKTIRNLLIEPAGSRIARSVGKRAPFYYRQAPHTGGAG